MVSAFPQKKIRFPRFHIRKFLLILFSVNFCFFLILVSAFSQKKIPLSACGIPLFSDGIFFYIFKIYDIFLTFNLLTKSSNSNLCIKKSLASSKVSHFSKKFAFSNCCFSAKSVKYSCLWWWWWWWCRCLRLWRCRLDL